MRCQVHTAGMQVGRQTGGVRTLELAAACRAHHESCGCSTAQKTRQAGGQASRRAGSVKQTGTCSKHTTSCSGFQCKQGATAAGTACGTAVQAPLCHPRPLQRKHSVQVLSAQNIQRATDPPPLEADFQSCTARLGTSLQHHSTCSNVTTEHTIAALNQTCCTYDANDHVPTEPCPC